MELCSSLLTEIIMQRLFENLVCVGFHVGAVKYGTGGGLD